MEELNLLLNQALVTKDKNYTSEDGLKICHDTLEKIAEKDKNALILFLYLFPISSPSAETNAKEFWFMKYKIDKNYNEYEFAIDLLKSYIQYLTDKNYENFEKEIVKKIALFKNVKFIANFFSVVNKYDHKIIATISYITRDSSYFAKEFEIKEVPENIQNISFIKKIQNYLEQKNTLLLLYKSLDIIKIYREEVEELKASNKNKMDDVLNKIQLVENENKSLKSRVGLVENENKSLKSRVGLVENENKSLKSRVGLVENENEDLKNTNDSLLNRVSLVENENKDLKEEIKIIDKKNNNLNEEMEINRKKMEKMEERLEKIDLRDTVKMSLRYIYKVLYSKLSNEMNYVTKIWEQIEEIEKLLSKPKFQRYSFISNFIDVINFSKLTNLNNVTHDSNQTRNFENIKKFLQRYSDENLDKVSNFFKDLPKIDKFIELNLKFYLDPKKADKQFEEIIRFEEIYDKVFEEKNII